MVPNHDNRHNYMTFPSVTGRRLPHNLETTLKTLLKQPTEPYLEAIAGDAGLVMSEAQGLGRLTSMARRSLNHGFLRKSPPTHKVV